MNNGIGVCLCRLSSRISKYNKHHLYIGELDNCVFYNN